MAGFPTVDSVVNALSTGYGQNLIAHKTSASACVAANPKSLWRGTGIPAAGGYGTLGKANGRVLTKATTGAIPFTNADASKTMHLVGADVVVNTASGTGTLILVDRITDVLLSHAEASGSISGCDASSRLAAGEGGMLWLEVQTAFSAASNTINFTYTNQAGATGRTTPNIATTASAAVDNTAKTGMLFADMQAGDAGIRALTGITLVSGTATGQFAACIVRPLAFFPLTTVGVAMSRDFVVEMPNLPRIYDDSCLQWLFVPVSTPTPLFISRLTIAQN